MADARATPSPATFVVAPGGALRGRAVVPGDKSVTQRALILGALAEGVTRIEGVLDAADPRGVIGALRALGVAIEAEGAGVWRVTGSTRWRAPTAPLDLGNSGTGLRLLAGALAGQAFGATLVGDASLSRRPMARVAAPLRAMGAEVALAAGDTPPLRIEGVRPLRGIDWRPEVASAQVKSAILLAGLASDGPVSVREPQPSRDHTERMLRAFGVECRREGDAVVLPAGPRALRATTVRVPGDVSSAAFPIVGAAMTPGSELLVAGVGLNPTRTAVLDILRAMGADLDVEPDAEEGAAAGGEPIGRVLVRGGPLVATDIAGDAARQAIDELPVLMIAAALAEGVTRIRDAAELRHKESDRLGLMADALEALDVRIARHADGLDIHGDPARAFPAARLDAHDDHRLAMAFAVAGLRAARPLEVSRAAAIDTSFPGFHALMRGLGLRVDAGLAPESAA